VTELQGRLREVQRQAGVLLRQVQHKQDERLAAVERMLTEIQEEASGMNELRKETTAVDQMAQAWR